MKIHSSPAALSFLRNTTSLCILAICLLWSLTACTEQAGAATQGENDAANKSAPAFSFHAATGTGYLIGKNIRMLNDQLKPYSINENLQGAEVEILQVSDARFPEGGEYCEQFQYVKFAYGARTGWIDGRNIYKVSPSFQDTVIELEGKQYKIESTEFYGVGPFDAGEPSDCFNFRRPIVFEEVGSGHRGLVELRALASTKKHFRYFEMERDADVYDEVSGVRKAGEQIIFDMTRHYQDTPEKWTAIFTKARSGKGYQAEVRGLK